MSGAVNALREALRERDAATELRVLKGLLQQGRRVWVPDEDGDLEEMPDGAVPVRRIRERLGRVQDELVIHATR